MRMLQALILYCSIIGCATSPVSDDSARLQVLASERAFARTMADRDHEAFATFIAEDAVFHSGAETLHGKDRIVTAWATYFAKPQAPFSWQPEEVEVLEGGSLAYSSGPVQDPDGRLIGRFHSIWRKSRTGVWQVIHDRGSDPCNCAPESR